MWEETGSNKVNHSIIQKALRHIPLCLEFAVGIYCEVNLEVCFVNNIDFTKEPKLELDDRQAAFITSNHYNVKFDCDRHFWRRKVRNLL